ncbi:MAG: hypothetical protein HKN70_06805 [Gammaproteobacteria bacterium]|nr:hypothetical protein [Gammaproteobacteria bacterium]
MNKYPAVISAVVALLLLNSNASQAAIVNFNVVTTVSLVEGSYVGDVAPGQTITGAFTVDNHTANAGAGSDPDPSYEPGHEYSSFWEFPGAAYSVSLFNNDLGSGFANSAPPAIVVNNNLNITTEQTGGLIADGVYDWIEILGSTTSDYCPAAGGACMPANGEEWSLAIFANIDWISGDAIIPAGLPAAYTAFLIGLEFDELGNETGLVIAPVDTLAMNPVPVPASVWFLASALFLLGTVRRRD